MTTQTVSVDAKKAAESSNKRIDGMIKGVTRGYNGVQTLVQETAVAIIEHSQAYGDCTRAKFLCRAVPARERNSLIAWFTLFSPIGVQMGQTPTDDKVKILKDESVAKFRENQKLEGADKFPIYAIEQAKQHPWYTDPAGKNPEPKPLSTVNDFWNVIDKMIQREIAKAEKVGEQAVYAPEERDLVKSQAEGVLRVVRSFHAAALGNKQTGGNADNAAAEPVASDGLPVDRVAA